MLCYSNETNNKFIKCTSCIYNSRISESAKTVRNYRSERPNNDHSLNCSLPLKNDGYVAPLLSTVEREVVAVGKGCDGVLEGCAVTTILHALFSTKLRTSSRVAKLRA